MIIPLKKLIGFEGNRYIFSRAAMRVIDKIANIEEYPEKDESWKTVPHILRIMLDDSLQYDIDESNEEET